MARAPRPKFPAGFCHWRCGVRTPSMRRFQWWSGNSMIQPNLWVHAMTPDHPKSDQWFSVDSQTKEHTT